jgi:DNA polymerase-3 subunit gamma/tau
VSQALYRKWRSQTFDQVIGQSHVTQTLQNALRDGRVAHAYLFSGPRGTGKTSTARILAKALNCTGAEPHPCNECATCIAIGEGRMIDLIEIDAASNNSVDDVRDLREKVGFQPSEGQYKIYIVDEVHMLSTSAFNALLKTLEEPPPHSRFVLATTEPHKIPATVLSRCQRFDFRRISVPEIVAHLQHIVEVEGYSAEEEALTTIARSAQGCMRDAISLLDQMLSYGTDTVTADQVRQVLGTVSSDLVALVVDSIRTQEVAAGLALIQDLVNEGANLPEFCQQVIDYLRGVMVLQMTANRQLLADQPEESVTRMQEQASDMALPVILHAIKRFSVATQELKGNVQPQLPLELALVEATQGPPVAPVGQAAATGVSASSPRAAPKQAKPGPQQAVAGPDSLTDAGPPPATESAALDAVAVQKLRDDWKAFLATVRKECGIQVQAALNSVRDIAVSQEEVVFAFGNNEFTHDMISKPDTLNHVADVLSNHLGRPLKLTCQMGEQATVANPIGAAKEARSEEGPDPLVEYAVSNLGAQVVE